VIIFKKMKMSTGYLCRTLYDIIHVLLKQKSFVVRPKRTLNSKKYGVDLIRYTHAANTAIHSSTKVDGNQMNHLHFMCILRITVLFRRCQKLQVHNCVINDSHGGEWSFLTFLFTNTYPVNQSVY